MVEGFDAAAVGRTTICSSVVDAVSIRAVKVTGPLGLVDVERDCESRVATCE